jgi:cytochrome c1
VIILHIWALHIPGSSNPTGVDVKTPQDTIPFHPYYTAKDGFGLGVFLILFAAVTSSRPIIWAMPTITFPPIRWRRRRTSSRMVFLALLRDPSRLHGRFILPAKLWGVLAMFAAILLLFFLPWIDRSPVRSGNYRPRFKQFYWILVLDVLILGYVGGKPAEEPYVMISQLATIYYFAHFLIILRSSPNSRRRCRCPNSIAEKRACTAKRRNRRRTASARGSRAGANKGKMVRLIHPVGSASSRRALVAATARSLFASRTKRRRNIVPLAPSTSLLVRRTFGQVRPAQLQRGFQVYKEVCAACHGINLVAFRNLEALGYNEPSEGDRQPVADRGSDHQRQTGEATTRKAIAADRFPNPIRTSRGPRREQQCLAARSFADHQGAASRPRISLFASDRYRTPRPIGTRRARLFRPSRGRGRGCISIPYFPNLNLAMPPPITADGQVTYADGTKPTRDQWQRTSRPSSPGPPSRCWNRATAPASPA